MMEQNEELTAEELKKKAYLMGLRLKNSGLDAETIYARLEKQGIPEDLPVRWPGTLSSKERNSQRD